MFKFGVYYDKKKKTYWKKKSLGVTYAEAFEKIRSSIISLIDFGKTSNTNEIKNIEISPMFKGKILSMYYPEKYLCIFAKRHLEWFLQEFNISFSDTTDEIDKRDLLMKFKIKDAVMKRWSVYEFMKFLYDTYPPPKKVNVPEELRDYNQADLPPINTVKADFVDLKISDLPEKEETTSKVKRRKIDFDKESKANKKVGDRGEEIVVIKEKEWLVSKGKKALADNVKHVAKEDDTAGYDVLSFELDGDEKYIEVKSTRRKAEHASFLISLSEYRKAQKNQKYYVYLVFEADKLTPKIFPVKQPFSLPGSQIRVTPVSYRVELNLTNDKENK